MQPLLKKPNTPPIGLQTNESALLPEGPPLNAIKTPTHGLWRTLSNPSNDLGKPLKSSSLHFMLDITNHIELTWLLRRLTRVGKFKPSVSTHRKLCHSSLDVSLWLLPFRGFDKDFVPEEGVSRHSWNPPTLTPGKFQCSAKRWSLQGKALSVHNEGPRYPRNVHGEGQLVISPLGSRLAVRLR